MCSACGERRTITHVLPVTLLTFLCEVGMNTMFLLMAEYGTATVPLGQVCEKYFGLKPATAEKRAAMGGLPIPTFRAAESQKAPRMIHIQDLADHIDAQLKKGRDLLEQMQSGNN